MSIGDWKLGPHPIPSPAGRGVLRLLRILIAVAIFLVLIFSIGLLLPSAWRVERSVLIHAPAPAVFAYLNNLKHWPEWTVSRQRPPELVFEYSGPATGVGATSRWRDEHERGVMKIMHTVANERIEYRVLLNGGISSVEGALMLVPEADAVQGSTNAAGAGSAGTAATRVVWGATGTTGRNPVARYHTLLLGAEIGDDFEASLQKLKQKFEPKP